MSFIFTFHTRIELEFDFSGDVYPKGWVLDIYLPFLSIGIGTGIVRES